MIKLLDDIALLDRLSIEEPYFGCIFASAAAAYLPQPELMSIWVELDSSGKAISALNVAKGELILMSGKKGPGAEMLMFMQKLSENGEIEAILCGENSFKVLKKFFPARVETRVFMKCSKHIKAEPPALLMKSNDNLEDLYRLRSSSKGDWNIADYESWKLRMTRDIVKGQTTVLTLYDGEAVASAVIRGRSKIAGAITSVMTKPEYRNRGYASFLTAECSDILHDEGRCSWLVPIDDGVRKLYEKTGFKAVSNEYTLILKKDGNK